MAKKTKPKAKGESQWGTGEFGHYHQSMKKIGEENLQENGGIGQTNPQSNSDIEQSAVNVDKLAKVAFQHDFSNDDTYASAKTGLRRKARDGSVLKVNYLNDISRSLMIPMRTSSDDRARPRPPEPTRNRVHAAFPGGTVEFTIFKEMEFTRRFQAVWFNSRFPKSWSPSGTLNGTGPIFRIGEL
ncbi:hypothetical protein JTB14_018889 [Gonioctena quinquepunctata]|nr:hypothetical protein JTB14_018889 [Gonioctena quinquepunctata]